MQYTVAIVGGGPRGLSALENLCSVYAAHSDAVSPHVTLFEPLPQPGAGQVYVPGQSEHNWLNVAQRLIDLPARASHHVNGSALPGFPSYWHYTGFDPAQWDGNAPDLYPTRGELGQYLADRFDTLAQAMIADGLLDLRRTSVIDVQPASSRWRLSDDEGREYTVHELAIAVGHQPTRADDQMRHWIKFANTTAGVRCVTDPFPAEALQAQIKDGFDGAIGLRGFGLTMIDVMKNLTEGLGGRYREDPARTHALIYEPSGHEPQPLIPFSLDGKPLGPKPVSEAIDSHYALSPIALEELACALETALQAASLHPLRDVLIRIMATLAVQVFQRMGTRARATTDTASDLITLTVRFLNDPESVTHALIDRDLPASAALEGYLGMAYGERPASLDYCLGQVWRHAQPTLYRTLSHGITARDDIAEIIALDERMKRYAFGPPPSSLERLLALSRAGIVTLNYVDDPRIDTHVGMGWRITSDERECEVLMMIDTVLDSATVTDVDTPLFDCLCEQQLIAPSHPGLGVATRPNGTAIVEQYHDHLPPIAVLGRLAQGSLLGVDAILECFGPRQELWAAGVYERDPTR